MPGTHSLAAGAAAAKRALVWFMRDASRSEFGALEAVLTKFELVARLHAAQGAPEDDALEGMQKTTWLLASTLHSHGLLYEREFVFAVLAVLYGGAYSYFAVKSDFDQQCRGRDVQAGRGAGVQRNAQWLWRTVQLCRDASACRRMRAELSDVYKSTVIWTADLVEQYERENERQGRCSRTTLRCSSTAGARRTTRTCAIC